MILSRACLAEPISVNCLPFLNRLGSLIYLTIGSEIPFRKLLMVAFDDITTALLLFSCLRVFYYFVYLHLSAT
jgi:hypothetical protein